MKDRSRLYGVEDQLELDLDINDTVLRALEDAKPEEWPGVLEIHVFRRMAVSSTEVEALSETCLEDLIDRLDEEFGAPGEGTHIERGWLPLMRTAVAAIVAEYEPWACEPTVEIERVDVLSWITEHAANWLDDPEVLTWVAGRRTA